MERYKEQYFQNEKKYKKGNQVFIQLINAKIKKIYVITEEIPRKQFSKYKHITVKHKIMELMR